MMARALGAAAGLAAFLAGAPWWACVAGGLLPLVPGRAAALGGGLVLVAALPMGRHGAAADLAMVAAGALAAGAVLARLGRAVPWVALPWYAAAFAVAEVAWHFLPPAHFWLASDVGARAGLTMLAACALVGGAAAYLPRYRNAPVEEAAAAGPADSGTVGARPERR